MPAKGLPPEDARRQLAAQVPVEGFRVAGVSFESRQELLPKLERGAAAPFALNCCFLCTELR